MNFSRRIGALVLVSSVALVRAASAEPAKLPAPAPQSRVETGSPSIEDLQRRFLETNDPDLGLTLARALVQKGRWLQADGFYREVAALEPSADAPPSAAAAKAVASAEREQLSKRMPAVSITVESLQPSAVQVFVNGVRVPPNELGSRHLVDPGAVRIRGVLDGTQVETAVEVGEGETRPVRLAFQPKPGRTSALAPPPAKARTSKDEGSPVGRVVGFVAMGVGGAAVITGGVFGVLALREEASLSGRCPKDNCPGTLQPDIDAYESKKAITTAGLFSGALLGVGGAILYLMSAESEPEKAATRGGVYWAGQQAGVWGSF